MLLHPLIFFFKIYYRICSSNNADERNARAAKKIGARAKKGNHHTTRHPEADLDGLSSVSTAHATKGPNCTFWSPLADGVDAETHHHERETTKRTPTDIWM